MISLWERPRISVPLSHSILMMTVPVVGVQLGESHARRAAAAADEPQADFEHPCDHQPEYLTVWYSG